MIDCWASKSFSVGDRNWIAESLRIVRYVESLQNEAVGFGKLHSSLRKFSVRQARNFDTNRLAQIEVALGRRTVAGVSRQSRRRKYSKAGRSLRNIIR